MKTMKLGKQTASLVNHMMSNNKITPSVERGATQLRYTDRKAYFVNSVSENGKKCIIEPAKAIRIDDNGMGDSQDYRFERFASGAYTLNLVYRYNAWWIDYGKGEEDRYQKININFEGMEEFRDYTM